MSSAWLSKPVRRRASSDFSVWDRPPLCRVFRFSKISVEWTRPMHDLRLAFGGKKQRGLGMEFHILRDAFVFSSRLLSGRRISQRTRPQGSVEWSGVPIFGDDKACPAGRPQSRCFRIHPFFSVTFCTLLFERLRGVPFHAVKPVKKEPVLPFHRRDKSTC